MPVATTPFGADQHLQHKTTFGLHAKSAVFDRRITFVGSFNLNPRSENLDTEMGLFVEGEALADAVAKSIEKDIAAGNSWRVIFNNDGKLEWTTTVDGVVIAESDQEPMTSAVRRAEAKAIRIIPDESQL